MHTIREDHDGFSVFPVAPTVTITRSSDEGMTQETVPYATVFGGYRPSTFDAEYKGDENWSVDMDCGAQRWRGTQTTRQVRVALRKCEFDARTINALMRKYRIEEAT